MTSVLAEVIAIGDEMIGGSRLDTNTQWIAQQLTELGAKVQFHATIGDELTLQVETLKNSAGRANVIVMTGGLGPTADDLTRTVISTVAGKQLVFHEESLQHIQTLFAKYGRQMPESNRIQAMFPDGANVIPNANGTAPGIDMTLESDGKKCRVFCLPGVPAEMKEMWAEYVAGEVSQLIGGTSIVRSRILNCFGTGESHTEELLGDLIARDRNPLVGITASKATISLRILGRGDNVEQVEREVAAVEAFARVRLGRLVYGVDDETLAGRVNEYLRNRKERVAILDMGLYGDVLSALLHDVSNSTTQNAISPVAGGAFVTMETLPALHLTDVAVPWESLELNSGEADSPFEALLNAVRERWQTDWTVLIGPLRVEEDFERFPVGISHRGSARLFWIKHYGHHSFRHLRSVKQVLNELRLDIENQTPQL
ncbi:MAG: molybdopterin-binding protein [Pirellulaceae bacterium]